MVTNLLNLGAQMSELSLGRCGPRLGGLLGETARATTLLLSGLGAQTNEVSLGIGALDVSALLDVAAKAATLLMAGLILGAYPHQLSLGLASCLNTLGLNASSAGQRIHRYPLQEDLELLGVHALWVLRAAASSRRRRFRPR